VRENAQIDSVRWAFNEYRYGSYYDGYYGYVSVSAPRLPVSTSNPSHHRKLLQHRKTDKLGTATSDSKYRGLALAMSFHVPYWVIATRRLP